MLTSVFTALTTPADPPVRLVDIPGKGKGLVASRSFSPGELIFSEKPLIKARSGPFLMQLAKSTVADLSPARPEAFYDLHASDVSKRKFPDDLVMQILSTNGFVFGTTGHLGGVLLLGSRLNSSCRPNTSRVWNDSTGVELFVASEVIEEGDELLVYYLNPVAPKAVRQRDLKATFDFDCTCETCSLEGTASQESDARRTAIQRLRMQPDVREDPVTLVNKIKAGMVLLEEEGLYIDRTFLAHDAFQICVFWGDTQSAKAWCQKKLECEELDAGKKSDLYESTMEVLKKGIERHPRFRALGRKTVVGP
jgi:hypothetical protein